jgi:lysophospholipase L1-like esterase
MASTYTRIVAVGDSTTEGVGDPVGPAPAGGEPALRGWADRVAERVAATDPDVVYANLAIRGRKAREIRDEQLAAAVALAPDLVLTTGGLNDMLRPRVDLDGVLGDLREMHVALHGAGATVVTFTLPDLTAIVPVARPVRGRLLAYNNGLRDLASLPGTVVVDLAAHALGQDRRLWAVDRLHPNAAGHERLADATAHALDLPGADARWTEGLQAAPRAALPRVVAGEAVWLGQFLAPWIGRRVRGTSSGDGRVAKRPALTPILPAAAPAPR